MKNSNILTLALQLFLYAMFVFSSTSSSPAFRVIIGLLIGVALSSVGFYRGLHYEDEVKGE